MQCMHVIRCVNVYICNPMCKYMYIYIQMIKYIQCNYIRICVYIYIYDQIYSNLGAKIAFMKLIFDEVPFHQQCKSAGNVCVCVCGVHVKRRTHRRFLCFLRFASVRREPFRSRLVGALWFLWTFPRCTKSLHLRKIQGRRAIEIPIQLLQEEVPWLNWRSM